MKTKPLNMKAVAVTSANARSIVTVDLYPAFTKVNRPVVAITVWYWHAVKRHSKIGIT